MQQMWFQTKENSTLMTHFEAFDELTAMNKVVSLQLTMTASNEQQAIESLLYQSSRRYFVFNVCRPKILKIIKASFQLLIAIKLKTTACFIAY